MQRFLLEKYCLETTLTQICPERVLTRVLVCPHQRVLQTWVRNAAVQTAGPILSVFECCPKRRSSNVSADDITVCNKRKRAARCGNLIWENAPKHSGNKSVQVWWPLCCWAPFYWEGTARKKNTTLSSAINFKIYINIRRHVQTTTIWHSWMPTRQLDHHWLIDRQSNKIHN